MTTIPDSDRPLAAALEAKGLPYPLPDRWEDPDPEMIRAYIHAAQDVVTAPGMDLELITDFSAAILEHITKVLLENTQWTTSLNVVVARESVSA